MKTKLWTFAILFGMTASLCAIGPRVYKHFLRWTPSPSAGVTGYYVYWAASTNGFSDIQRYGISTNQPFDLASLNLPEAVYWISMIATNAEGSESPLAIPISWDATK